MDAELLKYDFCPQDFRHHPLIRREQGIWCPFCRGWVVVVVSPSGRVQRHVMVSFTQNIHYL